MQADPLALLPEICLLVGAVAALLSGSFLPRDRQWIARVVAMSALAASATVPYAAPWNFTGQPACSVPAGFAADGLPRAVQFVGKPNDEATLLSLAAQIEAERPWAQHRPDQFA